MRIRILGAGFYGCHTATALLADGHDVTVFDSALEIFSGASGAMPARLHMGQHYPRSHATRSACQEHAPEFMRLYGHLTHGVPVNIYAVAAKDSLVDFAQYRETLRREIEFVTVHDPAELGLRNVEGALLTGERHLVIRKAKAHFEAALAGRLRLGAEQTGGDVFDWTIDCTFAALATRDVDRYEPCLTVLLSGPTEVAVTVMDGPFPSLYPFDEEEGISSLTSALLTPLSKSCRTYREARDMLDHSRQADLYDRAKNMVEQMAHYWPAVRSRYEIAGLRTAVRAMPRSAADARLVDVHREGRMIWVRAGKIDAVLAAERAVKALIAEEAKAA